jgi:hypothetical protein
MNVHRNVPPDAPVDWTYQAHNDNLPIKRSLMDGRSGGAQFAIYLGMLAWIATTVACAVVGVVLTLGLWDFWLLFDLAAVASGIGLLVRACEN